MSVDADYLIGVRAITVTNGWRCCVMKLKIDRSGGDALILWLPLDFELENYHPLFCDLYFHL